MKNANNYQNCSVMTVQKIKFPIVSIYSNVTKKPFIASNFFNSKSKQTKNVQSKVAQNDNLLKELNNEAMETGKPVYNFKKRLYTSYSKFTEVKLITIGIASPLRILQWAEKTLPNGKIYGEVLNANTLHHKTFKPQKGGLFCERIFGPLKDFECACGKIDKTTKRLTLETEMNEKQNNVPAPNLQETLQKNDHQKKLKTERKLRKFCPDCDVEYTWSVIRRYQLGYIKLISPVTHVWFLKGTPSYLSILLDMKKRQLQSVTYCSETLTIEHSDFVNNNLQSFKLSEFELDSPSKIYASWMKARESDFLIKKRSDFSQITSPSDLSNDSAQQIKNNSISKEDIFFRDKQKRLEKIQKLEKILLTSLTKHNLDTKSKKRNYQVWNNLINKFNQSGFPLNKNPLINSKGYYEKDLETEKNVNIFYSICVLQMIYLYQDLIENFEADIPFNIQIYLIQKNFMEKQKQIIQPEDNDLVVYSLTKNILTGPSYNKRNKPKNLFEHKNKTNSLNLISLITKKLRINLYIKSTLEIKLQKKVVSLSILKGWQDIYKKSFYKALHKSSSFTFTNVFLNRNCFVFTDSASTAMSNSSMATDYYDLESYFKLVETFSDKKSSNNLKKVIELVKIYYKKNILFAFRNLKKSIVSNSFNFKNTDFGDVAKPRLSPQARTIKKNIQINRNDFPPIPIVLSVSETLNQISNNLKSFFNFDMELMVDVLASKGFLVPLVLNQFLNEIKYSIISNTFSKTPNLIFTLKRISENLVFYNYLGNDFFVFSNNKGNQTGLLTSTTEKESFRVSMGVDGGVVDLKCSRLRAQPWQSHACNFVQQPNTKTDFEKITLEIYLKILIVSKSLLKRTKTVYNNKINTFAKTELSFLFEQYSNFEFSKKHLNLPNLIANKVFIDEFKNPILTVLNNTNLTLRKTNKLYSARVLLPITSFLLKTNSEKTNSCFQISEFFLQQKKEIKDQLFYLKYLNDCFFESQQKEFGNISEPSFSMKKRTYVDKELTNQKAPKKRLYNNIYTLSHRERWGTKTNEGKDWQIFSFYNSAYSTDTDQVIYAYKERLSSIFYNSQINSLSKSSSVNNSGYNCNINNLSIEKKNALASAPQFSYLDNATEKFIWYPSSEIRKKQNYDGLMNNSFFSGPGIVQQLLTELNFNEMKKLDKQNRLLLYILNKSIFKLKKQIKLFVYDKNAQAEMKELCKKRDLLIRRTKLVRKLFRKNTEPSSMILTVLPVLPPDLRPIVKMGGQIAASDLNRFYQRVIYRNDRLKKFLKDPATSNSYEMKYAQRLLQESVDNLMQNSQSNGEKDSRGRVLKSLSDILKGKQGRFRQFLLGKRVDYSGRSVIVVGPKLKLYECGIPLEMALELYLPFLLKAILNKNYSKTVVGAKALIKNNRPLALEILREIMQVTPVLLNRAPTLHRLGFQAFVPKLVEGRAILLHPLVCSSFNADFDGDQMAVHVPITIEARAEAWKLMLSRNNILSPATGDPLAIPSQDMILGCYYLTTNSNKWALSLLRGSGFFFNNFQNVLYAYNLQKIDLHASVWVKWLSLIENGNDQEEPVEIRISQYGNWQELSRNYIRYYNYNSILINQFIATTPGRILFYNLIQSIK